MYWYCGWSRNTLLVTVKPRKYIQVGGRTTEFTLVDCPTADDRLNRPKKQWQVEARKKN